MTSLAKLTLKIYLYKFFDKFMLIYPLYAVMFKDYHMDPLQIAYLFMAWKVTSLALEFPSGVTADKYSRKNQLIVAQALILVGYVAWILMPNFWGFLIGFVLWGAKGALTSGTFEALVYDELKALGREDAFTKVYGRTSSVGMLAISLAALVSVAAFQWGGYPLVLRICIFSIAISTIALASIKEVPIYRTTGEIKMFQIAKKGIKDVLNKKSLLIIVIFTALLAAISTPIEEYTNLLVVDAGLAVAYLGLFTAAWAAMDMLGGLVADRFENTKESVHYFLVVLSGLMLFVAALLMNEFTIVLLILEAMLNPVVNVIFEGKIQNLTASDVRATTASIRGFLSKLGSVLMFLLVGIIANASSYKESFIFLAVLSLIVGLGFMVYAFVRREKVERVLAG